MADSQDKPRGIPSKQVLYQKAAGHAIDAIEVLAKLMYEADNDAARVGAAKVILAKCIPDLKAQELSGKDGKDLLPIPILNGAASVYTYNGSQQTSNTQKED